MVAKDMIIQGEMFGEAFLLIWREELFIYQRGMPGDFMLV